MSIDLFTVRFGPPAAAALAAVVAVHQQGDPFAPVTVLVPDNLTGVLARRELAATRGVVNVSFSTPAALAARVLPPTAPSASRVVLGAVARDVLAAQTSGLFAPVATHPATESALVGAHLALAAATPESLDELGRSPSRRTRAVVGLHRQMVARLGDVTDEHGLARAAAAAVRAGHGAVAELGSLVVHLVDQLAPASLALVEALGAALDVTVLVGVTGVVDADGPLTWWLDALGRPDHATVPATPPVGGLEVFSATDSDDEVRNVVRELLAEAEAGTPFADMVVLYPAVDPYPRLVHEHLEAAGIPHNGPAVRTLATTVAGRVTQGFLDLVGHAGFARRPVLDLAAVAPGTDASGLDRPIAAWDRASRTAGVIGGLADWRAKLAPPRRPVDDPAAEEARRGLLAFVEELATRAEVGRTAHRWPALATWLADAVRWLVGDPRDWPAAERDAVEAAIGVIDELAGLAAFDPRPGLASLARAVETAFDVPAGRIGTLGVGVQTGPLDHARARTATVVFVVGLAEGLCPAPSREDTLLPDAERRLARHGELALAGSRVTEQRRALLAAQAAAGRRCVLGFPRGDHRGGRTRLPSRWLLDVVGEITGVRPSSEGLADVVHPHVRHVASFAAGLAAAPTATHATEHRLQLLHAVGPAAWRSHPAVPATLARGAAAVLARRSAAFTEWDANLAGCAVPSPAGGAVLSATRLEAYAACPARYYFASVLGLRERDAPEELDAVDPRDRGTLVHRVLERFIAEVLARPPEMRPGATDPWTSADAARLHAIATEEFAAAEARGITGPPVLWRLTQYDLRQALDGFLADDTVARARTGAVPEAVELAFGFGAHPALRVTLDDSRTLAFRGFIDRVDRTADGSVVVYDYKTGNPSKFGELAGDPVVRGTRLQLPLYALAAAEACRAPRGSAHYWFVGAGGEPWVGYPVDAARLARLREVLAVIVDGIEAGMFVARPGADNAFYGTHANCAYCEFDRICPRARGDQWVAKTAVPADAALAAYVELAGGAA